MSPRWLKRRTRLREILTIYVQDEDEEALAIDRLLHGQNVIGKTGIHTQRHSLHTAVFLMFYYQAKTIEIDKLRFSEKDLTRIGTLERGSFGEVRQYNSFPHPTVLL